MQLIDHQIRLQLPAYWPRVLEPEALNRMDHQTPFLVCDLDTVRERYTNLTAALPGVNCYYAVKCNPEPELLAAFDQLGSSFEVASWAELQILQKLGVDPERVLYSNTVKPAAHIAESFAAGLWRYAFDSEGELYKLAQHAPGAAVYVRLRVDDSTSVFPLSRKFGAEAPRGPGPAPAGAQPRPAALRGDLPRRLPVHHHDRLAPGHRGRRAAAAAACRATASPWRCSTSAVGSRPATSSDVPSVDQIGQTIIESALHELLPYRPDAAGRRARALPGGRERGAGRRRPRPGGSGPARTGSTSTSAPTTG